MMYTALPADYYCHHPDRLKYAMGATEQCLFQVRAIKALFSHAAVSRETTALRPQSDSVLHVIHLVPSCQSSVNDDKSYIADIYHAVQLHK